MTWFHVSVKVHLVLILVILAKYPERATAKYLKVLHPNDNGLYRQHLPEQNQLATKKHGNSFTDAIQSRQFPQAMFNFKTSIPQGTVIAGVGLILLKELSAGYGTWIFIPVLIVPLFLIAIGAIFVPTNLWTELVPAWLNIG